MNETRVSTREFARVEQFKNSVQEREYIDACIRLVREKTAGETAVAPESVNISARMALFVRWSCRVSFRAEFHREVKECTGVVAPAKDLLRVAGKKELEEKIDTFLQLEKERQETIHEIAKSLKDFRVGHTLSPKRIRTHPVQAVWEQTCPTCNGRKEVTCKQCSGHGSNHCQTCRTSGKVTCRTCDGYGRSTCSSCHGSGKVTDFDWNSKTTVYRSCPQCIAGFATCQSCHGQGTLACTDCSGKGDVRCHSCSGTGHITCESCSGTGTVHSVGRVHVTYKGELEVFRLQGLFFDPHAEYAATYTSAGTIVYPRANRIDTFFENGVPVCALKMTSPGNESNGACLEIGLHGSPPRIHDEQETMQKIVDAFIRDRVHTFAEQGAAASLFAGGFTRNTAEQLSSFLKIPAVAASLVHEGKSEQEKKALDGIQHRLQQVKRYVLLRGAAMHLSQLAVAACIASFTATDVLSIAKYDIYVQKSTVFLVYSLVQGSCIALASRLYSVKYVSGISKSLSAWAQRRGLLFGSVETLILLAGGAVLSLLIPFGT